MRQVSAAGVHRWLGLPLIVAASACATATPKLTASPTKTATASVATAAQAKPRAPGDPKGVEVAAAPVAGAAAPAGKAAAPVAGAAAPAGKAAPPGAAPAPGADPLDPMSVAGPPEPGAPKVTTPEPVAACVEAPASDEVEKAFARRYRKRHCALCSDGIAVEPIPIAGRAPALDQILERTAAGVRGQRRKVALYYFYIPCKPCDRLLPDVHRAIKRNDPTKLEVIPIVDAPPEEVDELLEQIMGKFPAKLSKIPGIYRDAARRGAHLRDVRQGVPVTIVFSGRELSKVAVLYGDAQTRFWRRAAGR